MSGDKKIFIYIYVYAVLWRFSSVINVNTIWVVEAHNNSMSQAIAPSIVIDRTSS